MNNPPKITIGLPVYNGVKYLHDAIESLLKQSIIDIDILISDNGSTDATESICRTYAERDKRIRYVRQINNLGAIGNFDYVFQHRAAPFFMWAAHDDIWGKDFIKDGIEAIERENSFFAFPTFRLVNIKDKKSTHRQAELFEFMSHESTDYRILNYLNLHTFSYHGNIVYSIFKEETLKVLLSKTHINSETLFGSFLLRQGRGSLIPNYQFSKRYYGRWPGDSYCLENLIRRLKRRHHDKFYKIKANEHAVLRVEFPHLADKIDAIYDAIRPNSKVNKDYKYVNFL